jgi:hypothetical protein
VKGSHSPLCPCGQETMGGCTLDFAIHKRSRMEPIATVQQVASRKLLDLQARIAYLCLSPFRGCNTPFPWATLIRAGCRNLFDSSQIFASSFKVCCRRGRSRALANRAVEVCWCVSPALLRLHVALIEQGVNFSFNTNTVRMDSEPT